MPNKVFPIGHPDSNGPDSHMLPTRTGADLVRRYHDHMSKHDLELFRSVSFHAEAIKRLLAQDGAAGVRFSLGINDEGSVTLVGFAVDKNGNVVGPEVIDNAHPCPPWC